MKWSNLPLGAHYRNRKERWYSTNMLYDEGIVPVKRPRRRSAKHGNIQIPGCSRWCPVHGKRWAYLNGYHLDDLSTDIARVVNCGFQVHLAGGNSFYDYGASSLSRLNTGMTVGQAPDHGGIERDIQCICTGLV